MRTMTQMQENALSGKDSLKMQRECRLPGAFAMQQTAERKTPISITPPYTCIVFLPATAHALPENHAAIFSVRSPRTVAMPCSCADFFSPSNGMGFRLEVGELFGGERNLYFRSGFLSPPSLLSLPARLRAAALRTRSARVDGLSVSDKCLKTAVDGLPALDKHAKTTVDGLSASDKCLKTAVDGLPVSDKCLKTAVDGLSALDKCLKTAVDSLPALDKHAKTTVDAFSALNKYPETAVDGISSPDKYQKTAVDGIPLPNKHAKTVVGGCLSLGGGGTAAVAAVSCGFGAGHALGYITTQNKEKSR